MIHFDPKDYKFDTFGAGVRIDPVKSKERKRLFISLFESGLSYKEIAERFDLSIARVRRIISCDSLIPKKDTELVDLVELRSMIQIAKDDKSLKREDYLMLLDESLKCLDILQGNLKSSSSLNLTQSDSKKTKWPKPN